MKGQVVPVQPQGVVMAQPVMAMAQPMQMQGQPMQQQGIVMQGQPMQQQGMVMQDQSMQQQGMVMQGQPMQQQGTVIAMTGKINPISKQPYAAMGSGTWTTGICGCFDNCAICCYGFFCGYCLFGAVASHIKPGGCCSPCCTAVIIDMVTTAVGLGGCSCFYTMSYRTELRMMYGLPEQCGNDCFAHCCCNVCALCQEGREIEARMREVNHPSGGFNMGGSKGIF
jgi:Cys-rich protein (TIGR01571 family)